MQYQIPESATDKISPETLELCAQIRSERAKLESGGGRYARLLRQKKSTVNSGAARIFKQLAKNGTSVSQFARQIAWSPERTMRLVTGQETPLFHEIPEIANALKLPIPTLLVAYGYPKDTFTSNEGLAQAMLIEAERP